MQFADIRYPTIGIDVQGRRHIHRLRVRMVKIKQMIMILLNKLMNLEICLQVIAGNSVAGELVMRAISTGTSLMFDWPEQDGPGNWATMFDIDYADGFRGDNTFVLIQLYLISSAVILILRLTSLVRIRKMILMMFQEVQLEHSIRILGRFIFPKVLVIRITLLFHRTTSCQYS